MKNYLLIASLFLASAAGASPEKIGLFVDQTVNPESGELTYKVLNPNAVVDVTYTTSGLQLSYTRENGAVEQIKIMADFPSKPEPGENVANNMQNEIMSGVIESNGRLIMGNVLKGVAQQIAAAGGTLLLKLDRSRKVGFVVTEYGLEDVTLITPGESVTLARAIFRMISAQARDHVSTVMAKNAPPEKHPPGFTRPGQSVPYKQLRFCEAIFVAAN